MKRTLTTYGNYFMNFYSELDKKVQTKLDYVFELVRSLEKIPVRFFKHLEGSEGIFEIRIEFESNIYRILCFFDEVHLVVLMNGFQKKSQKTPKQEIELAEKLKRQYFIDKKIDFENGKRGKV